MQSGLKLGKQLRKLWRPRPLQQLCDGKKQEANTLTLTLSLRPGLHPVMLNIELGD